MAAGVALLAAAALTDAGEARGSDARRSAKAGASPQHLSAKAKARARRSLTRSVRRDPRVVTGPSFLRRAALVDFSLPITARLSAATDAAAGRAAPDDVLELGWSDESSPSPWPDLDGAGPLGYGPPAPPTITTLSGRFTMEWDFGADATGYGGLGAMEARIGQGVDVTATPADVSDFAPSCPAGPAVRAVSRRIAGPADAPGLAATSGGTRVGVIDLASGRIRGSLLLRLSFRSQVTASCGAAASATRVVNPVGGTGSPPVPVWFDGRFRLSPAFTADGRLRLARIDVDTLATPQRTTFGSITSCTQPYGVIDDATCVPGDGDATPFPARLSFRRLTAELIIGDATP